MKTRTYIVYRGWGGGLSLRNWVMGIRTSANDSKGDRLIDL